MQPMSSSFISPSLSSTDAPQNNLSPETRSEMSKFLMLPVTDQHTDLQINNMLIRAFNTGTFRHDSSLFLSRFDFTVPAGETCVVPPEVRLEACRLLSAATMELSSGSLCAARHGATVVATGISIARAITLGSTAIALDPGCFATAECSGAAYALGRNTTAIAYFGGTAYADGPESEAQAKGLYSMAHARVKGATSHALEFDSKATASHGAKACAFKSGAVACALTHDSVAYAIGAQTEAHSEESGAEAIGRDGGKAIADVYGAAAVNSGNRHVSKEGPHASYGPAETGNGSLSMLNLFGQDPESVRLSRNVNFQGRFGNESITAQDLDLDDEPVLEPPRLSKREVQAIRSRPEKLTEPVAIQVPVKPGEDEGNRFISNEELDLLPPD